MWCFMCFNFLLIYFKAYGRDNFVIFYLFDPEVSQRLLVRPVLVRGGVMKAFWGRQSSIIMLMSTS